MDGRVLLDMSRTAAGRDGDVDVGNDVRAQAGPVEATTDPPRDLDRIGHTDVIPRRRGHNLT